MNVATPSRDGKHLSELIGAIYDCAIDPDLWDGTLDQIRRLLACANAILYVTDPLTSDLRLLKMIGVDAYWAARLDRHDADLAALHATLPDFYTRPLDRPFVCRRDARAEHWFANGYYREWAAPQGIVDVIDTILVRRPDRVASCALCRHERFGLFGDSEIRLAGLIAPHLRRAVTISDLIDLKRLEADALGETLDLLTVGIVLVAEDGAIVHANRPAETMLARGEPIRSVNGRLATGAAGVTDRLDRVVAMAASREWEIGTAGIGMALTGPEQDVATATAYILPLAGGSLRTRLLPRAAAAVFISSNAERTVASLEGVADTFALTRAETRVLARLVAGDSIEAAASALGVARPTLKTHLARILSKTGARRQADLIALVHGLVAPTVAGGNNVRVSGAARARDSTINPETGDKNKFRESHPRSL